MTRFLLPLLLFLSQNFYSFAQTTLWNEPFNGYNNSTTGNDNNLPAGADWTIQCPGCMSWQEFRATSGRFRVRDNDVYGIWTSELISLSGYENVSVSVYVDASDLSLDPSDCIRIYYRLNGGAKTQFPLRGISCDGNYGAFTSSVSGLNGNDLRIIIEAITDQSSEDISFDNVVVRGTEILPLGKDGPGGVGKTDGTGKLATWLKADDLNADGNTNNNPSNNVQVSTWSDNSGSGQHYSQSGSNRPRYQTGAGYNSVYFNASPATAQYMNGSTSGSYTNASAFFAFHPINSGNSNTLLQSGSNSLRYEQYLNSNRLGFTRYGVGDYQSTTSSIFGSNVIASYHKFSASASMSVRLNNASSTFGIGSASHGIPFDQLGRNSNGVDEISGNFYEVILYKQRLSNAERIIVENYLSAKYGAISIADDLYTGDLPANGNYDFEVAGIGQASDGSKHIDAQGSGIIRIQNPANLGNNEWLFWGHNNAAANSWGVTDLPTGIAKRMAKDWTVSETGNVGSVDISVDLSSVGGAITASDLRLLIDDNGVYNSGATAHGGAVDMGGRIYKWTGIELSNNNHFTVASVNATQTPLPVELNNFEAIADRDKKQVNLIWVTSSELNNNYFTVEKTEDLVEFEEVLSVSGQGTTNLQTKYHEIDHSPNQSISYYRLSQTDFNGNTEYFDLAKVDLSGKEINNSDVTIFPNPNKGDRLSIQIENSGTDNINVIINDMFGRQFNVEYTAYNKGKHTQIIFDIDTKLAPGNYVVNINTPAGTKSHTLIVE